MSELALTTPEQLTQVVESLVLTASDKFDLNKRMANRARQFFRQQIRKQRDIENNPYQPRRRKQGLSEREAFLRRMSKPSYDVNLQHRRAKNPNFEGNGYALNTTNNRNMMSGFAKGLRTSVTEDSFEVGLRGVAGKIAREHNEGSSISFTTRVNGFYDNKVGRWQGGTRVKNNYEMPRRTFIGWTPALERELLAMAAEHFALQEAA